MLVAAAVFLLLVVLLLQVVGGFSSSTQNAKRAMYASSEARGVLDRLGFDITGLVRSGGITPEITKASGNDSIRFLSQVHSVGSASRLSVVDYQINSTFNGDPVNSLMAPGPKLGRAAAPFAWINSLGSSLPGVTNGHLILGESILRFEVSFLDKDSVPLADPPMDTGTPPKIDLTKVSAIVVTVAALDVGSRAKLSAGDLDGITLPDPSTTNSTLDLWNNELKTATLSPVIRQNLRFFERIYYLP